MSESGSDDRRPVAERSDDESVGERVEGDEWTRETQPTTLEEDASKPEDKSIEDKKPEDKKVKLEVKLNDVKVELEDQKGPPSSRTRGASWRSSSAPRKSAGASARPQRRGGAARPRRAAEPPAAAGGTKAAALPGGCCGGSTGSGEVAVEAASSGSIDDAWADRLRSWRRCSRSRHRFAQGQGQERGLWRPVHRHGRLAGCLSSSRIRPRGEHGLQHRHGRPPQAERGRAPPVDRPPRRGGRGRWRASR
ncbi:unnamed protein product [Prorocentrum cordatum]|uniref:Uncharacterized protein n=1 Tax=Prorocentrum cordatum TaxID=2364126 RepID=A0ABN9TK95_9DINO|nr:unnamed protein product [Polarella glacialis]